jgi:hypothetical protein
VFTGSAAYGITSENLLSWNDAYGWGNHADYGYLTTLPDHNHDDRYYTESESDTKFYLATNPSDYQTTTGTVAKIASGDISNLNTAWKEPGSSIANGFVVYRYGSSSTNQPVVADNANWLINIYSHPAEGEASYGHQLAAANGNDIYFRSVSNGTFSGWHKFWSTNDFSSATIDNWNSGYDNSITAASFATATGILTLTQQDLGTVTVNLDGRYLTSASDSQTLSYDPGANELTISNGNSITLEGLATETFVTNQGYITGISFANVSSKPTTIAGYGITDAITTANIGSQSVSYADSSGNSNLLKSLGSYVWSSSTNGRDFQQGLQVSFVSANEGYQNYGSVVRVHTYPNDGASAELYFPYSEQYGGNSMQYRLGLYPNAGWSSWKTVVDSENIGEYALTSLPAHTHTIANVTGLQTALDGKLSAESDTLDSVTGRGATTSNLITITSSDVGLKVQENGTSTAWRGRIGSFNSSADKSSFLGNYTGRAGVFGHNNALSAWDDLWVNTLGIYGQGNLYLSWNTYVKGNSNDTNYPIIHSGNISSQSVNFATSSGNSSTTDQTVFGSLFINDAAVATKEFVTSQGYLTTLPAHNHDDRYYTETESDTRYVNTSGDTMSGNLTLSGYTNPHITLTTTGGDYSYLALYDGSTYGYIIKNVTSSTANGVLAGSLYLYTDNNKATQIVHNGVSNAAFLSGGDAYIRGQVYVGGNGASTGTQLVYNSGTWSISISGNAATATNLIGLGSIQSTSTGTSYINNYQVRENSGGGSNTNEIYAPQLAFHWSGVVASSIMMEASGRMAIRNNPGDSYENFIAAVVYSYGYGDSTQWNTAYGWGNHSGLYLGLNSKAADSELIDGIDSSRFIYGQSGNRRGTNLISNWNQNDFPDVAFLSAENAGTNAPTGDYTYGMQYSFHRDGAAYRSQLVTALYSDTSIYVRNSRDSDVWTSWKRLWHSGDFTSTDVSNWNTAYNDRISSATVTGTTTKTLTLTQGDGGTVTASWTDYDTDNDAQQLTWDKPSITLSISNGNSIALEGLATEEFVTGQGYITGSYLPLSGGTLTGTLTMGTTGTQYIRMGRFPNSTTNTGEAWIGRAADRSAGTMTVQLGGNSASSRSFEVVDYAWSVVLFSVGSDGNLSVSGTITENSSIRYKKDIVDIESTSSKVQLLRPVKYKKIRDESEEIGLIAEDVAELFPEVVKYDNEGRPDGVNYSRLSVILLKAVQELTERVNKLENK